MTELDLVKVARLPMALPIADIERWVHRVISETDAVAQRAAALVDLQDRQAMHQPLFAAPVRAAIEAWLQHVWVFHDLAFLDAAATLILSQGLSPDLLNQTVAHGPAEAAKLAREALDEC